MFRKFNILIIICLLSAIAMTAESPLTPADFGLTLTDRGQIDFDSIPPNVLINNFNGDCYPDILRWQEDRMELFIFQGNGYSGKPSAVRCFDKPVEKVEYTGHVCDPHRSLKVTLIDGTEEIIPNCGYLQLERETNYFKKYDRPPARVCETDFQIVWESEPRPYGMDRCAVGDLDNDGITELVTWWKEGQWADTAYILIYKSIGDDEYELFMEERFYTDEPNNTCLTSLMITDLDQNGQKELVYTRDFVYFWEFSAPGVYHARRSDFGFARAVKDATVSDVDQDGILELAFICCNYDIQPSAQYLIEEYEYKTFYYVGFDLITGFYDYDWDARFAVGDFDNDGAINIVAGNFNPYSGLYLIDTKYFCYDSTEIWNFSQHWISPGYAVSCCTPVIADFDDDGLNELYAGGVRWGGGGAWLYEGTGLGIGAVTWIDTTTLPNGPNEAGLGIIDYKPSVVSIHILWMNMIDNSQLYLMGLDNSFFSFYWQSLIIDSVAYYNPGIIDMDFDEKINICLAGSVKRSVHVWEQVSVGVGGDLPIKIPVSYKLLPNIPNPFNKTTIIPYIIKTKTNITIKICDILGQEVFNYTENEILPGEYQLIWDSFGLSSGIYFIFFKAGDYQESGKAVLMK